jgi:hypothetical protein
MLLANLLKSYWDYIFFDLPVARLNKILWDQWFDGTNDITVRFRELVSDAFSDEVAADNDIICDPYGTTTHFKSSIDIHLFVRDNTLSNQTDVIPIETDKMLRYLDDWLARHPLILQDAGISKIIVTDSQSDIPFDDEYVTHSIITVQMSYTKMYL